MDSKKNYVFLMLKIQIIIKCIILRLLEKKY
jgi:hypothetical protein